MTFTEKHQYRVESEQGTLYFSNLRAAAKTVRERTELHPCCVVGPGGERFSEYDCRKMLAAVDE